MSFRYTIETENPIVTDGNKMFNCKDGKLRLKIVEDNPWHTGTPTETGLYVIAFRFGNKIEHEIREMFYSPDYGMTFGIKKDIVAWQKIEPYKEKENDRDTNHQEDSQQG